jgi:Na+-transporting methylmalonyl-CoA/oxaloacetate decarboxylase gamma subunit
MLKVTIMAVAGHGRRLVVEGVSAMLVLWILIIVAWTVGLFFLARWMRRRTDEAMPVESTLTDAERAQAQLGIALTAANTLSTH